MYSVRDEDVADTSMIMINDKNDEKSDLNDRVSNIYFEASVPSIKRTSIISA